MTHYPRRYLDRSRQARVAELEPGEEATLLVQVRASTARRTRHGRSLVELRCSDGSATVRVSFFNQPWRSAQLPVGTQVVLFGRLERFRDELQLTNPEVDLVGDRAGRIVPLYRTSERAGLTTWELAGLVREALERAGRFAEPLPAAWLDELGLIGRDEAVHQIHLPASSAEHLAARERLAFDELLRLQLALVGRRRARVAAGGGIRHRVDAVPGSLLAQLEGSLPFRLTPGQASAVAEILADLAAPVSMHRLFQGDVGAGKTVVALHAMVAAVQGGYQAALLAPTEVLAEQHFAALERLTGDLRLAGGEPLRLGLLTARLAPRARAVLLDGLATGGVHVAVGTHALLTEDVRFASLGLVVVDEQHRFGVEQRAQLRLRATDAGAAEPDLLVMTATPIPRTAAMTVYGDLDLTVLGELPPGRRPVRTIWARGPLEVAEAWGTVRQQVAEGGRAYVVCPLVDGSERVQARSATEEAERLAAGELSGLSIDLLHGQMGARAREKVMAAFRDGEIDVLVATTVIEVGVDVEEASVMVVESADRFGLAQLHQLRGRVGRATRPSWCFLLTDGDVAPDAAERLAALVGSNDGFALAEVDLSLRGEGTVLGVRQQGRSDLRLASLATDEALVRRAREVADALLAEDPRLTSAPLLAAEVSHFVGDEAEFLLKS